MHVEMNYIHMEGWMLFLVGLRVRGFLLLEKWTLLTPEVN